MSSAGFEIYDADGDGIVPISPAEARARMLAEYKKLRNCWFPEEMHAHPATFQWLLLAEGSDDIDHGYSSTIHLLRMVVREADLQSSHFNDFPAEVAAHDIYQNFGILAPWRVYLAHELCHEYQFKVLDDLPDEWGTAKFAELGQNWDGPGHTAAFYSAIRAFAQRFDLDANAVVSGL